MGIMVSLNRFDVFVKMFLEGLKIGIGAVFVGFLVLKRETSPFALDGGHGAGSILVSTKLGRQIHTPAGDIGSGRDTLDEHFDVGRHLGTLNLAARVEGVEMKSQTS